MYILIQGSTYTNFINEPAFFNCKQEQVTPDFDKHRSEECQNVKDGTWH